MAKRLVHRSTVVDQPGRPVAASCAISGCHYFEIARANRRLQQLVSDHGEPIPTDILKALSDLDHLIERG